MILIVSIEKLLLGIAYARAMPRATCLPVATTDKAMFPATGK